MRQQPAITQEAGVSLAATQKIMRHGTPAPTAKHYVRLSVVDKAAAIGKLPDFKPAPGRENEAMRATGTDGKSIDPAIDTFPCKSMQKVAIK
ncbi:MAG: hypothetical protein LBU64_00225 [Planctomycetota bacterium]|nr:hypothetical protein [Planctomycetota bacterium]